VQLRLATLLGLLAVLLTVSLPGAGAQASPLEVRLPNALDAGRMRADLVALERIADANGGRRSAGTPGYAASVRYVRDALTRAGYRPRVLGFPFVEYSELVERGLQLAPQRRSFRVEALNYSPSTPAGGVRGRVVSVDDGCEPGDFANVRGVIALARRGSCFFAVKAQNAGSAGAVALVVFNNEGGPLDGTLGDPQASSIPVVGVDRSTGMLFEQSDTTIELTVRTRTRQSTSHNVVADVRPGARRVLLVGAHLDSVYDGPGINDNGTGVAAVLEIARVLKRLAPNRPVRFAFWGAEEFGLIGSSAYARTAQLREIAGYLNFDMLGTRATPRQRAVYRGPFALRWLDYFRSRGLRATSTELSGSSDHAPFAQRGIPVGGLFAGTDRCYHAPCDRVRSIDFALLRQLAAGAAFGVAAFSPGG
jgi:Zn-dependent M28 family amino/carboxypeptidase